MIGYLKGKVIDRDLAGVVVEVGGVGYAVRMVNSKWQVGEEIELWVHTHVREDELCLYGFADKKELRMFELLLTVNGVGPKVGMTVVAGASVARIEEAIARADVALFTGMKGLGKKGAQKIIIELKNKIGSIAELDLSAEGGDEVLEALVGMGYERSKVVEVLRGIDGGLSEEERIKKAIKLISKSSPYAKASEDK